MIRVEPSTPGDAAVLPSPPPPEPRTGWALFVDIDGTLVEFAAMPDLVRVAPATLDLIRRLQVHYGDALAVLSGRGLADVDQLLAPLTLPAGALHGLERRQHDGRVVRSLPPEDVALRVARACRDGVAALAGVHVEEKAAVAFALHYRRAPAQREPVLRLAAAIAAASDGHYAVQPGDCVAELKPVGQDKGSALAALLATPPFLGRRPLVLGDDLTDETAFAAAAGFGGQGVIVGTRRPTLASHALASPEAVRHWLAACAAHYDREHADGR